MRLYLHRSMPALLLDLRTIPHHIETAKWDLKMLSADCRSDWLYGIDLSLNANIRSSYINALVLEAEKLFCELKAMVSDVQWRADVKLKTNKLDPLP